MHQVKSFVTVSGQDIGHHRGIHNNVVGVHEITGQGRQWKQHNKYGFHGFTETEQGQQEHGDHVKKSHQGQDKEKITILKGILPDYVVKKCDVTEKRKKSRTQQDYRFDPKFLLFPKS